MYVQGIILTWLMLAILFLSLIAMRPIVSETVYVLGMRSFKVASMMVFATVVITIVSLMMFDTAREVLL